ncbi:hypothetical protein [Sellimonas intestinalis]|uniref:hypothetical protein n=1 Tax=Sellimonas intestinalis TaxID=1653434 RepID=UPI0039F45B79
MIAEELLKQMSAEPFAEEMVCCVIDPETRVIDVPAEYQLLGVESDEKVERMYFQCPKIVGDNIDLSKLALRVNFRNANDQKDQYIVDDVEISGDNITFSWLLSRRVTQYKGNVSFIVCAVKASGEEITNEWNTTLATAQVLEGLEADITLPEEDTDVVKQLIAVATQKITDVQNATSSANTAASNADIKAQEAANAAEDARGVIDQITKDSYLHTTTQTFVDTVKASPTAYGNAIPEQIEGYIKQDTTKGLQLFDAKTVLSSQIQSKVLTCNNDGSETLDGEITGSNRNFTIQLSAGTYYFNEKDKIFHTLVNGDDLWNKPYTFETDTTIKCYIANGEYGNIKIYPMINKGDSPLSIEPYTGGQPSPNPDYPQIVHGVGDMGFFDGELLQGYYQVSDGTFKPATVALCNKNPIPCKPGDKIIFEYEDVINGSGISIFFYKSDGTFISRVNKVGVRKIEGVAPQDTTYCNIVINPASEPIPVASAKHITVTINDKYAVCVKSKGKNLLDFEGFLNSRGSQYTKCGDRYRITGTGSAYSNPILLSDEDEDFTLTGSVTSESGNGYSVQLLNNAGNVVAFIRDDTKKASGKGCKIRLNYVGAGAGVYEDIMVEKGTSHDKYIPCQSTTTYIPVDYPLFEGDKIVRSNGEYKLLRKWNMKTYDGTETGWFLQITNDADINNFALPVSDDTMENNGKTQYSNILKKNNAGIATVTEECFIVNTSGYTYVRLKKERIADLQSFKTYLAKAPITIAVQRSTPTEEPLSSEAMKALYSIMACDEETELTIVGVPSDAEIQNQFLLPRNEDGALNTTAYCTAKRNEIALEELENATAARLSALETQALQEV